MGESICRVRPNGFLLWRSVVLVRLPTSEVIQLRHDEAPWPASAGLSRSARAGWFCAYLFAVLVALVLCAALETAPYYKDNPDAAVRRGVMVDGTWAAGTWTADGESGTRRAR